MSAFYHMPEDYWLQEQFKAVDTDYSGAISTNELQRALSNGNWKPFR